MLQATHEGELRIGATVMTAAVLPNGKRLLSQATFLTALGRSAKPKAGTGAMTTVDGLPSFLQADALKAFISDDLRESTTPIFFRTKSGRRAVGYDAQLLAKVCEVYLRLRDASIAEIGRVPKQYEKIISACDVLMRGFAEVGIVALVDEATGYQEVRDREALQAILDAYLRDRFAAWAKRFPDEFYQQIFRLRSWNWKGRRVNPPQAVAQYTKNLIYERLAPHVLEELEKKNPVVAGRRVSKHHQWLTDDVGHPALAQHLHAVIGLMRVAATWDQLMTMVDVAFPKCGDTLTMSFMSEPIGLLPPSSR